MLLRKSLLPFFLLLLFFAIRPVHAQTTSRVESLFPWQSTNPVYTILAAGSAGPPPSDGHPFTISGRVHDRRTGAPVNGAQVFAKQTDTLVVELYDVTTGELRGESPVALTNPEIYSAPAASDGSYLLSGLSSGMYTVWVEAENSPLLSQFYPDTESASSARALEIATGTPLSEINFSLVTGGSIMGRVSQQADNAPGQEITVSALDPGNGALITSATVAPDGTYLLEGLPSGAYKIKAENKKLYVDAYYGGSDTPADAIPVPVELGQLTPDIDIPLKRHGIIEGTVLSETATPLASVSIKAYRVTGLTSRLVTQVITDQNGSYRLVGLPPGSYTVFADAVTNHVDSFFPAASSQEQATSLQLDDGAILSHIDFSLATGGIITGTISDLNTSLPLNAVDLKAFEIATGVMVALARTRMDGSYQLEGLPSGTYRIAAQVPKYRSVFYGGTDLPEMATPVPVTSGQTSNGIDIALQALPQSEFGAVTGRIFWNSDHAPVERGCVTAYDAASNSRAGYACSGQDGTYTIEPLATGAYKLCVRVSMSRIFIGECYDDIPATLPALAAAIPVSAGEKVNDIDFGLARIGSIAGTIIRKSDKITIGSYEVKNIPGSYYVKIRAANSGYSGKYYKDSLTIDSAAPVSIIDGQTTASIDFALEADTIQSVAAGDSFWRDRLLSLRTPHYQNRAGNGQSAVCLPWKHYEPATCF